MVNTHFNECDVFKDSGKKCKIRTMFGSRTVCLN